MLKKTMCLTSLYVWSCIHYKYFTSLFSFNLVSHKNTEVWTPGITNPELKILKFRLKIVTTTNDFPEMTNSIIERPGLKPRSLDSIPYIVFLLSLAFNQWWQNKCPEVVNGSGIVFWIPIIKKQRTENKVLPSENLDFLWQMWCDS